MIDGTDIIDCIQNKVNEIAKTRWENCYKNDLKFWISRCFSEDYKEDHLILTINHCNICFSRILYPRPKDFYELDTLEEIMESLYNQTM